MATVLWGLIAALPNVSAAQCPTGECVNIGTQAQFNDVQAVVPPPIVEGPIYACTTRVHISGFIPGATLRVFVNGVQVGASFTSILSDGVDFVAPAPFVLSPSQVVTATQQFGATQSLPSVPVPVTDHLVDYPAGLPAPVFNPLPVFGCGRFLSVGGWIGGATIGVTRSASTPTAVLWSGGSGISLPVGQANTSGETLSVHQTICTSTTVGQPTVVLPPPASLPTPIVDPYFAGQQILPVRGTVFGAALSLTRDSVSIVGSPVASWDRTQPTLVVLNAPLAATGGPVQVTQALCSTTSPAASRSVLACSSLPPALIGYPEIGDTFVTVIERIPGSRIQIFARATPTSTPTEIGDGGGLRIALTRALVGGEQIVVVQRLGACTSVQAHVLTVRCATQDRVAVALGGPFNVGIADYNVGSVSIPLVSAPVRLIAHVRFPVSPFGSTSEIPAGAGPRPIVFLMHGAAGVVNIPPSWGFSPPPCVATLPFPWDGFPGRQCVPPEHLASYVACGAPELTNYMGYLEVMDSLAAAGIVAVSINANDTMCNTLHGGLLDAGAQLFREHADFWAELAAGTSTRSGHPFGSLMTGRVDMLHAGLFGHSRGGERAPRAAQTNTNPNVAFVSQYLVAPSDNGAGAGSTVVATSIPTALIYGSRDSDTRTGEAFRIYDRATVPLRSLQYVYGANHRGFNSTWPVSDPSPALSTASPTLFPDLNAAQQRSVLTSYVRSWFEWTLLGANPAANRGLATGDARLDGAPTALIFPSFSESASTMFDNFENNDTVVNMFGPRVSVSPAGGFSPFMEPSFGPGGGAPNGTFFHATRGLFGSWSTTPTPFFTSLTAIGGTNYGTARFLQFRAAAVQTEPANNLTDLSLDFRLGTGTGTATIVQTIDVARIPAPYPATPRTDGMGVLISGAGRTALRTVRIPTRCLTSPASSLQSVFSIRVRPLGNASSFAIDDIEFAN